MQGELYDFPFFTLVWPGTGSAEERVLQAELARDRGGQMVMRVELCDSLSSVGRPPEAEVDVWRDLFFRLCVFSTFRAFDSACLSTLLLTSTLLAFDFDSAGFRLRLCFRFRLCFRPRL